jgi:hypothetical protein
MSTTPRTAREVVELYNLVVWNKRDFALAEELIGDTITRHEVGEATVLTHEEAVNRIIDRWAMFEAIRFDLNLVVAGDDGEHVAIVYQSTSAAWRSSGSLPGRSSKSGIVATSKGFGVDQDTRRVGLLPAGRSGWRGSGDLDG